MRKFKHKITLNIAYKNKNGCNYVLEDGTQFPETLPLWVVENSNDWEEVKEFPKIVSFRKMMEPSVGAIAKLHFNGYYSTKSTTTDKFTLSDFLYGESSVEDGTFEIYQVAVSEEEVFTLGDKVKHPFNDSFDVISKFIICNDPKRDVVWTLDRPDMIGKLVANVGNYFGNCNIEVSRLEKAPEVLFVTEDGVEMLDGDKFYYISISLEHFSNCYSGYAQEGSAVNTNYKYFSTVEAAKKYFDDNKPIYSKKQIKEALEGSFIRENYTLDVPCCCADRFKEELFVKKLGL